MAKHDRTGRSKGGERFIKLDHYILNSPAWRDLSPEAVKILLAIWQRFNGSNNGEVSFSCREGEVRAGLSRNRTQRAIVELMNAGFIKCSAPSTFDQKQLARTWRLTMLPTGTAAPTKEFMHQRTAD